MILTRTLKGGRGGSNTRRYSSRNNIRSVAILTTTLASKAPRKSTGGKSTGGKSTRGKPVIGIKQYLASSPRKKPRAKPSGK